MQWWTFIIGVLERTLYIVNNKWKEWRIDSFVDVDIEPSHYTLLKASFVTVAINFSKMVSFYPLLYSYHYRCYYGTLTTNNLTKKNEHVGNWLLTHSKNRCHSNPYLNKQIFNHVFALVICSFFAIDRLQFPILLTFFSIFSKFSLSFCSLILFRRRRKKCTPKHNLNVQSIRTIRNMH